MAYTKEILTLAVEIGDCMLRNGAEIYRVEDTVVHILSSYEVEEFDVYVLSNGIFASANENKEDACSIVRHVPLGAVNLAKISALNQLARDICDQKISLIDSWDRLEQCKNIPNYKKSAQIFFCGLGSACFCYLFGGNWLDFVYLNRIAIAQHRMLYAECMDMISVHLKIFILLIELYAFYLKRQLRRNRPKCSDNPCKPFRSNNGKRLGALGISHCKKKPRQSADMVCMKVGDA